MTSLRETLLHFIDDRMEHLLSRPGMWGPDIAVELQFLQLAEIHSTILHSQTRSEERFERLRNAYFRFLRNRIPDAGPLLLSGLVAGDSDKLTTMLREFWNLWTSETAEENPFENYDLVLRLRFRSDVSSPPTSLIGHYYETFRRAIRGIARPNIVGRTPREIEQATEFTTPDVHVSSSNGTAARVLLPLQLPVLTQDGQPAVSAQAAVKDALTELVTVAEWANTDARVEDIVDAIPVQERRQRVAFQAMRLLPPARSLCQSVELGGRTIQRLRPMALTAGLAGKLGTVIRHGQVPAHFELEGTVRKLDLDVGSIGMRPDDGSKRVELWITQDVELQTTLLDCRVQVTGEKYQDPLGRPFYFVQSLKILDEPGDES